MPCREPLLNLLSARTRPSGGVDVGLPGSVHDCDAKIVHRQWPESEASAVTRLADPLLSAHLDHLLTIGITSAARWRPTLGELCKTREMPDQEILIGSLPGALFHLDLSNGQRPLLAVESWLPRLTFKTGETVAD